MTPDRWPPLRSSDRPQPVSVWAAALRRLWQTAVLFAFAFLAMAWMLGERV